MKSVIFSIIIVCLLSGIAGAGTVGFAFLRVPVDARSVAMGGAFTALPGEAMGLYWNPAAIATIENQTLTTTYTGYLMDMQAGFAGWVSPSEGEAVGVSLNYFYGGSFIRTTMLDPLGNGETFSNNNVALSGTYAKEISPSLSVGASARFVYSNIDTYNGNAFLMDAGVIYSPSWISLGFAVRNAGIQTKSFYMEKDPVPMVIAAGVSAEMLDNKLLLTSDISYPSQGSINIAGGVEYSPLSMLSLRVGGNLQDGENGSNAGGSFIDAMAFGIGTSYDSFALDYAWKPFADLGSVHRVSLGMSL